MNVSSLQISLNHENIEIIFSGLESFTRQILYIHLLKLLHFFCFSLENQKAQMVIKNIVKINQRWLIANKH